MPKESIDMLADDVTAKIQKINEWIRQNPDTSYNFYEIMDCYVEVGQIIRLMANYYAREGYPLRPKEDPNYEQMPQYTHYDITKFDSHANACWSELLEMLRLKGFNMNNPGFWNEKEASEMLSEINQRAFSGEYLIPEHPDVAKMKKEVLCRSMGILYYIWNEQRSNPDFKYISTYEFEELKRNYEWYKKASGIECTYHIGEKTYEGPQFGLQIDNLINRIEKSYKYSKEYGTEEKVKTK